MLVAELVLPPTLVSPAVALPALESFSAQPAKATDTLSEAISSCGDVYVFIQVSPRAPKNPWQVTTDR